MLRRCCFDADNCGARHAGPDLCQHAGFLPYLLAIRWRVYLPGSATSILLINFIARDLVVRRCFDLAMPSVVYRNMRNVAVAVDPPPPPPGARGVPCLVLGHFDELMLATDRHLRTYPRVSLVFSGANDLVYPVVTLLAG